MRITVSLDTQAVITQPSPARAKAGGFVPVEIAFTRGSQAVMLPVGTAIEFALKPKNTWTGGMLVYHSDFAAGAGGIYIGAANFSSEPLLAALGLTDNAPANDVGQIETAGEIVWNTGTQKFRSATFVLTVEAPLTEAIIIPPADPTLYPAPDDIEVIARKGQPGGYAGLDLEGKVPPSHLPLTGVVLREASNRFLADHSGWKVGDIIRQTGDSTAPFFRVEVTDPVPGGAQEVVEITALPVPEGQTSGFQFFSAMGTTDPLVGPLAEGPLNAQEHASLIHATLEA